MDTNRSKSENQLDRLRRKIVKTRYKLFKGNDREYHDLFNHAYYFSKPKGMSRKRFDIEQNTLKIFIGAMLMITLID